jgi:hypothetical protein
MSRTGSLLGTFPLADAAASDWEDIAIGPKTGGGNYLYLGDIGDNNAAKSSVSVHRVVEPLSTSGATIAANAYTTLNLTYPNGARDVESMFVDPISGDMFFITKRKPVPEVYSVPTSAFDNPTQTIVMNALGTFPGVPLFATAADISPDGRFIVVRSSVLATGYLYERGIGESIADALHGNAIQFALGSESQGEAIGWAANGASFFTTSELDGQATAPIHSYAFTAPPAILAGDYNNDHRVDAADYTVWRNQFGAQVALPNEIETLGIVTTEDYDVWRAHFGESSDGGAAIAPSAGTEVVPEPATLMLVVMAACAFGLVARRGT